MNLKDLVRTGIQSKPPRIVLHGPHGIGKSTFGASAPSPIFLITEDGLTNIDVSHFDLPQNLDEVFKNMGLIINEAHEFKTFVLDTLDWLENLIWEKVCTDNNVESIESIGYGKGYGYAMAYWERFINGLERMRDKGMVCLLLAHNEIKTFSPPDSTAYDRYQIKLNKLAAAKIEEWADAVLFCNYKVYVTTEKGKKVGKAVGGKRVIYTEGKPAWKAKNRYSLPEEMEFNFDELITHIKKGN